MNEENGKLLEKLVLEDHRLGRERERLLSDLARIDGRRAEIATVLKEIDP